MILAEGVDVEPVELRIAGELATLPACKSFGGAEPKSTIAAGEQTTYVVAGERLTLWRLPENGVDAIEATQAGLGCKPDITVLGLSKLVDDTAGNALANLPRRVRILADVECRIQRERAAREHEPRRHDTDPDACTMTCCGDRHQC